MVTGNITTLRLKNTGTGDAYVSGVNTSATIESTGTGSIYVLTTGGVSTPPLSLNIRALSYDYFCMQSVLRHLCCFCSKCAADWNLNWARQSGVQPGDLQHYGRFRVL